MSRILFMSLFVFLSFSLSLALAFLFSPAYAVVFLSSPHSVSLPVLGFETEVVPLSPSLVGYSWYYLSSQVCPFDMGTAMTTHISILLMGVRSRGTGVFYEETSDEHEDER